MSKHYDAHAVRQAMAGAHRQVLTELGVPDAFFTGKHQPCPCCGGTDRARWAADRGCIYCNKCGGPEGCGGLIDPIQYLQRTGCTYPQAVNRIGEQLGLSPSQRRKQAPKRVRSAEDEASLRSIVAYLQLFEHRDPNTVNPDDVTAYNVLRDEYRSIAGADWPGKLVALAPKWVPKPRVS